MANNVWEKLNERAKAIQDKRRLKKILNKTIATYEKAKDLVQMNRSINEAEADALIKHYDNHISALNSMKRENNLDRVKAFPTEDGSDIIKDYNNFLSRNRIDNQATNQLQVEAPREQLRQEQVEIAQPDAGRARNSTQGDHRNSPRVARVQHDNAGRPEQGTSTAGPNVMDNNANTDIYASTQNYYRSGVINRFENAELPPTPNASESNSTGPADPPRGDSLNYNGAESGSSIQEEADVNELVSSYEDREEANVDELVSSYEDREADVNELISSYEDREEADVNELVSSYEDREEADVDELVSSYEDREEADVNDLVSSYPEQENVRDVTSENYSDRRVSSSFDSSIVSYDASNSLDTSTTSYDTRSSLGTSTTSYDTRSSLNSSYISYDRSSSLDSSYISYDRSSSLDSSYFSSDKSHNSESNTGTYSRNSSESNSARRNSSQLGKNDSYQRTESIPQDFPPRGASLNYTKNHGAMTISDKNVYSSYIHSDKGMAESYNFSTDSVTASNNISDYHSDRSTNSEIGNGRSAQAKGKGKEVASEETISSRRSSSTDINDLIYRELGQGEISSNASSASSGRDAGTSSAPKKKQLVKNDSYQQTNNPNNQRRNSQSF